MPGDFENQDTFCEKKGYRYWARKNQGKYPVELLPLPDDAGTLEIFNCNYLSAVFSIFIIMYFNCRPRNMGQSSSNKHPQHPDYGLAIPVFTARNQGCLEKWMITGLRQEMFQDEPGESCHTRQQRKHQKLLGLCQKELGSNLQSLSLAHDDKQSINKSNCNGLKDAKYI